MRSLKTFATDLARKPPLLISLVGLAHLLALCYTIVDISTTPGGFELLWLQLLWLCAYTFFWLAVCDLRRWGVWGYLGLTILNTVLFVSVTNLNMRAHYTSNLFIIDIIFSFFLVLYYKRFS